MDIKSPAVGKVLRLSVEPGAIVARGDEVMVVESMKVEIPIKSPAAGRGGRPDERISRQAGRSDPAQFRARGDRNLN